MLVDTGDLRDDLVIMLKEILGHMTNTEAANPLSEKLLFRLFGEAKAHPEFLQVLHDRVYAPRLQHIAHFIRQAQAFGHFTNGNLTNRKVGEHRPSC